MFFGALISAIDFDCLTKCPTRSSHIEKREVDLIGRYFDASSSSQQGISSISRQLKIQVPNFFNSKRQTTVLPVVWNHMDSISDSQIKGVIASLNTIYKNNDIPVSFKLKSARTIPNSIVSSDDNNKQANLFNQYADKSKMVFNIFSIATGTSDQNVEGWTLMPMEGSYADAIFINDNTLNQSNDAIATILAHESGHWLGLYHVFEGGCKSGAGDYVRDTPKVDENARTKPDSRGFLKSFDWKCDQQVDTCTSDSGNDLVSNMMDYTNCKRTFTNDQKYRMMNFVYYRFMGRFPSAS